VLGTAASRFHGICLQGPIDFYAITITGHGIQGFEFAVDADLILGQVNLGMPSQQTTSANNLF
jgi:hypothetical protein